MLSDLIDEVVADIQEGSKEYSWFAWKIDHFAKAFGMSYARAKGCFVDIEQGSSGSCLAFPSSA